MASSLPLSSTLTEVLIFRRSLEYRGSRAVSTTPTIRINEAIEESQNNSDNAAGAVAASFVIAIFLGLGVALAIVAYAVILLGAGLCLIFTIKNRKSTLLPIRIISFVYDGLAGAIVVLAIVKILLLAVFKV